VGRLTDPQAIRALAERALDENPTAVSDYLAGKAPAFEYIFGQVMRLSRGRVDPEIGRRVTRAALAARGEG
jgi:aspartyl-tRNA(Asn)/glutamyl-tRNA(Gln) amidotransferase subunit B